jgi:two-component system, cell cycle response regulator DivK
MTARILIAEDHPASLELMRYLLEASGYSVLIAADGAAALEIARREPPDLVICDLQMPHIDGYEVLRQMRKSPALKQIPIIAVTAFSMVGDREMVLAAGFNDYHSKPIEPEVFVGQMEQHLPASLRVKR